MIKNYTTTIDSMKSIQEIIGFLVEVNAKSIAQDYEKGECVAIKFLIDHNGVTVSYKLQPSPDAAYNILISSRKRVNDEVKDRIRTQSYKTAWRILRDWVDAQCALIKLQQATPLQLFLSYAYDEVNNVTFYNRLEKSDLKLLKS